MMNKAEAKTYRDRLVAMRSRLDGDRSQLRDEALHPLNGEASGGLSNVPIHPADLGTDANEEELTLGLLENEEQLIEEINGALERLDEGAYGRCDACKKAIPKRRLHAVPYARYCVTCSNSQKK